MLGISTSGGVGFCAKVQPHRYGYVGRLVAKDAAKLPCEVSEEDRHRIGLKIEAGEMDDVLDDIRLSEGGGSVTLDIRSKSHRKEKRRTGSQGMKRSARHAVRGSVVALASTVPDRCLSFFTATCQEINYQVDQLTASNWNKVVDVFVKRLRRRLADADCPQLYVHVSEIQEKRYIRTGKPYLHLHLVFQGRRSKGAAWAVSYKQLRTDWIAALNSQHPEKPYYMAVCEVKACNAGVGRYLSKYLSKGGELVRDAIASGYEEWMPRQWWGCARAVVAEREALTYRARGVAAQNLWDIMRTGGHGHASWIYPVEVEGQNGQRYTVGYCFALTEAAYTDLMVDGRLSIEQALT